MPQEENSGRRAVQQSGSRLYYAPSAPVLPEALPFSIRLAVSALFSGHFAVASTSGAFDLESGFASLMAFRRSSPVRSRSITSSVMASRLLLSDSPTIAGVPRPALTRSRECAHSSLKLGGPNPSRNHGIDISSLVLACPVQVSTVAPSLADHSRRLVGKTPKDRFCIGATKALEYPRRALSVAGPNNSARQN